MNLQIDNLSHAYSGMKVLDGIDLTIEQGQIVCVIGPSGCGKSTLLRMIGGLELPTSGQVLIEGKPVHELGRLEGFPELPAAE